MKYRVATKLRGIDRIWMPCIGKILVDAGTEGVAVNTLIAVLLEDGEVANSITEVSAEGPVPTAAVHESLAVI